MSHGIGPPMMFRAGLLLSALVICFVMLSSPSRADAQSQWKVCVDTTAVVQSSVLEDRLAACNWLVENRKDLGAGHSLTDEGLGQIALYRSRVFGLLGRLDDEFRDIKDGLNLKVKMRPVHKKHGAYLIGRARQIMQADPRKALDLLALLQQGDVSEYLEIPRAEAYSIAGNVPAAVAEIEKWAKHRGGMEQSLYSKRAGIYLRGGDLEKALADLVATEKMAKKEFRSDLNDRARTSVENCVAAYFKYVLGDKAEALADAHAIVANRPGFAFIGMIGYLATGVRGSCMHVVPLGELEKGNWQAALDAMAKYDFDPIDDRAKGKEEPTDVIMLYAHGWAHELKGDRSIALASYKAAAESTETSWDNRFYGDKAAARLAALEGEAAAAAQAALEAPGKRIALVIGNSVYESGKPAPGATRDAKAVAEALRRAGFTSVTEKYDLNLRAMNEGLKSFGDDAVDADWALIYFAGHGLELDGANYVLPVDAKIAQPADVGDEAVGLERLISKAAAAKKIKLVIVDAARDNEFKVSMRVPEARRSTTRGLGPVEPKGGVFVTFAAKEGQVVTEEPAGTGLFAEAFAREVERPGSRVIEVFDRVREGVAAASAGRLTPATYGAPPSQNAYFNLPKG